jgi:glutamate racemase
MPDANSPIGIFDSGVGGLAVLAELRRLLPSEHLVYYADSANFPYGPKPRAEIIARADAITDELLRRGCKLIVVACNSATSAAVAHLRERYAVPIVSIEPALKPAAEQTIAGKVAILATPATAEGEKLSALIDRYGAEVAVQVVPAPDLAERVERGEVDTAETRALIRKYLAPVRDSGADVLALGCTHYAFLRRIIEEEAGEGIAVIEPSDAVARQAQRVLEREGLLRPEGSSSDVTYLTSGDPAELMRVVERLRAAGAEIPEMQEAAGVKGRG